jgi:hypothetical protein
MGRPSKATKARRNNIRKLDSPKNSSVEDVSDEDSDFEVEDLPGFIFLDDELQSEDYNDSSDSEAEEVDEDELDELLNEAEIDRFNAILFEAQAMAVKAEREAIGEKPKRK